MSSIRRDIARRVSVATLVATAVAFALVYVIAGRRLTAHFDDTLRARAAAVAALLRLDDAGGLFLDEDDAPGAQDGIATFDVRDGAASLLRSPSLPGPLPASELPAGDEVIARVGRDGRPRRVLAVDAVAAGEPGHPSERLPPRAVRVVVVGDAAELAGARRAIGGTLAAAFAAVAAAVLVAVPRAVARGLAPLRAMADRARTLDADDLAADPFPTVGAPAEIAPIAARLNAAMRRLGAAFDRERRFAAGAAHELRTPLAAIRANAEVALRWPDPASEAEALRRILTSATRMQSLVERLLELARLDARPADALGPVDLAAIVDASLAEASDALAARGLRVERDVPADAVICSDASLLCAMIDNLVANAACHARAHSTVRVAFADGALTIENDADDLEPDDLARLFDPLWTKSTDRAAGRAGLGLSLVRAYARAIGAEVRPALDDGRFAQRVTFPASAAAARVCSSQV